MQETWFQFMGWEDALGWKTATCSGILDREIPRTVKPGRLHGIAEGWTEQPSINTKLDPGP